MRKFFCMLLMTALLMTAVFPLSAFAGPSSSSRPKKVALTFDDGPHPYNTDKVLDLLAAYSIPATFFVIGVNAEHYPAPLRRAVAEGHEIGNHTYSHPRLTGQNAASFAEELEKTEEIIRSIAGVRPVFFRPPMGIRDDVVRAVAEEKGYELVLWTIDTRDWAGASASSIEKNIFDHVTDGSIILCHDYVSGECHTLEALEHVIPVLLEQGYEFVTVSGLIRMR